MKDTKISWAHHTFNPWWGCTEVSPGCDHCYARVFSERLKKALWGAGRPRVLASDAYWQEPLKWDAAAAAAGERHRVFCASMADFADAEVDPAWRKRLGVIIKMTPNLDWLLLTKRPGNVPRAFEEMGLGEDERGNVWLGTSVESQSQAWRARKLLEVRGCAVYFVSAEPLLGPLDLERQLHDSDCWMRYERYGGDLKDFCVCNEPREDHVSWVIVGAESGPHRRPFENAWALSLLEQARAAGVAVWMKQGPGLHSEAPFGDAALDGVRELPGVRVA